MPPKPKFGKAEIINAGLTIAKNEGLDQVTARSIAKTLGSSVCPVFSYFDNMEHLKNEIVVAAKAEYKKICQKKVFAKMLLLKGSANSTYFLLCKSRNFSDFCL